MSFLEFFPFLVTSVSASFESTLTEDKSQGWHVFVAVTFSVSLFLLSVLLFLFDAFELPSINANFSLFADFEEASPILEKKLHLPQFLKCK